MTSDSSARAFNLLQFGLSPEEEENFLCCLC